MPTFLDFEKPIAELQARIDELRDTGGPVDIGPEVTRLQAKSDKLLRDTFARLTPWQKTQVARHPERPHFKDYVAFCKFLTEHINVELIVRSNPKSPPSYSPPHTSILLAAR